jgi:arabinogalactan endo-1,4-beta-galactosidase
MVIRSIVWPLKYFLGHLEHFSRFGMLNQEKSGNPESNIYVILHWMPGFNNSCWSQWRSNFSSFSWLVHYGSGKKYWFSFFRKKDMTNLMQIASVYQKNVFLAVQIKINSKKAISTRWTKSSLPVTYLHLLFLRNIHSGRVPHPDWVMFPYYF